MSDLAGQQLVARINGVRFSPVRLRQGYEIDGVDTLLEEMADAVSMGRAVGPLVEAARFTQVRMREGYDMAEVDRFLAGVVAEADGTLAATVPPTTTPPTPTTAPTQETPPPVIEEQSSTFDRLFRRKR